MDYLFHLGALICIYVTLCISLDLVVGHTGLLSLVHAGIAGIGAYAAALMAVEAGVPFIFGVGAGLVAGTMLSFVVSIPSIRLHGDYFAIATFGFQILLFSVFSNWIAVTRGPFGIPGIPAPQLAGYSFATPASFLVLAVGVASLAYLVVWRLAWGPFGRVLRAIREDEVFVWSLGRNVVRYKLAAFAVSAGLAAAAGALLAYMVSYIHPNSFTVMESILVLSMVIIGGAGSRWGALIGATLLVVLPELLRFVGLPAIAAAQLRMVIYGLGLVIIVMFRPQGLVGTRTFGEA